MPVDSENRDPPGRVTKFFTVIATAAQLLDFATDVIFVLALVQLGRYGLSALVLVSLGAMMLFVLLRTAHVGVRRLRALGLRLPWPILILAPLQGHVASACAFEDSGLCAGTEIFASRALRS